MTIDDILKPIINLVGENEAVVGQNNTTVNKYLGRVGEPYCMMVIMYALKKAGCHLLDTCYGYANVGILSDFCNSKGWKVNTPKRGDIFIHKDKSHGGFVYSVSGNTAIFLEGNYGHVYKTINDAKAFNSNYYEGIGYRYATNLNNYIFYRLPIDGGTKSDVKSKTEYIKEFQQLVSAKIDGIWGNETYNNSIVYIARWYLSNYPIQYGSRGDIVKLFQIRLIILGYDIGDIDGIYGNNCKTAIMQFQKANNLESDGVIGIETGLKLLGG